MPLPIAEPCPSLCLRMNLGFFQGLGEAHGGLITPPGLSASLLYLASLLLPLSDIPGATTSWTGLGFCRVFIVFLGFPPSYLGFIFPSLLRGWLLIHLCFLALAFCCCHLLSCFLCHCGFCHSEIFWYFHFWGLCKGTRSQHVWSIGHLYLEVSFCVCIFQKRENRQIRDIAFFCIWGSRGWEG